MEVDSPFYLEIEVDEEITFMQEAVQPTWAQDENAKIDYNVANAPVINAKDEEMIKRMNSTVVSVQQTSLSQPNTSLDESADVDVEVQVSQYETSDHSAIDSVIQVEIVSIPEPTIVVPIVIEKAIGATVSHSFPSSMLPSSLLSMYEDDVHLPKYSQAEVDIMVAEAASAAQNASTAMYSTYQEKEDLEAKLNAAEASAHVLHQQNVDLETKYANTAAKIKLQDEELILHKTQSRALSHRLQVFMMFVYPRSFPGLVVIFGLLLS